MRARGAHRNIGVKTPRVTHKKINQHSHTNTATHLTNEQREVAGRYCHWATRQILIYLYAIRLESLFVRLFRSVRTPGWVLGLAESRRLFERCWNVPSRSRCRCGCGWGAMDINVYFRRSELYMLAHARAVMQTITGDWPLGRVDFVLVQHKTNILASTIPYG